MRVGGAIVFATYRDRIAAVIGRARGVGPVRDTIGGLSDRLANRSIRDRFYR